MINQINDLIEVNLRLLFNTKNNSLKIEDFKDVYGNKFKNTKDFAKIMKKKELITEIPNEEFCFMLTEFGKQISKNGGWLEHLEKLNKTDENILVNKNNNQYLFNNKKINFIKHIYYKIIKIS